MAICVGFRKVAFSNTFLFPLQGDPATLPLIAWQFVVIEEPGQKRTVQPVLAFARDQTIFFYQVGPDALPQPHVYLGSNDKKADTNLNFELALMFIAAWLQHLKITTMLMEVSVL